MHSSSNSRQRKLCIHCISFCVCDSRQLGGKWFLFFKAKNGYSLLLILPRLDLTYIVFLIILLLVSVSPEPEFYVKPREEDSDQFLVLACDGVWDVMSNEDICNFIIHRMKVHDNLETICNEVIDTCLYKVN